MIGALAAAAAVLLLVSGAAKLRTPGPATVMLATLTGARRVPGWLAGTAGLVELVVGLLFLVLGGRLPALLLAGAYVTLTAVAARLLRSAGSAGGVPCGCFGRADTPIGSAHLVLDVLAGLAALAAVVAPVPPAGGLLDGGVAAMLAGSAQVLLLAWLAYLAITALPALTAARRAVDPALPAAR